MSSLDDRIRAEREQWATDPSDSAAWDARALVDELRKSGQTARAIDLGDDALAVWPSFDPLQSALAWAIYRRRAISSEQLTRALALPVSFVQRHYFFNELYAWYVRQIQQRLLAGFCDVIERYVIIGFMVNGTAALTRGAGRIIRLCQTGGIQTYVLGFLAGVVWLLAISVLR